MPLKIESGTYTVNRRRPASVAGKKLSKFTLWRHWRRSVHEERGSSEERWAVVVPPIGDAAAKEVASLTSTDKKGTCDQSLPRTSRRSRPHSLAVQPLHYQRLDPEQQLQQSDETSRARAAKKVAAAAAAAEPGHQPNMTSQESIGSCSLDVEKSASDRSDANAGSLSEKTLHSLNLSCNGEEAADSLTPVSNGHQSRRQQQLNRKQESDEQLTSASGKKPSYLGLACSISGYTGITRYDSKLREGFRSRDSSPGARLIHGDTSPAALRANESLSQSISPLAMERHNGFSNGLSGGKGYSEVDRGLTTATSAKFHVSPLGAPSKRIAACNQRNGAYTSFSSSKSAHLNVSNSSYTESSGSSSSILNGSSDLEAGSEKSFIQQRVERLYGPGALAQGFFFKRSTHSPGSNRLNLSGDSCESANNNNTSLIDETQAEESLKSLPVLRHLRPEFRAQLPVVSPRRPTDGTEQQIVKPLKRISVSPAKIDAKETKASPAAKQKESNSLMTASATSLTDQQPAAPKVVLPVLAPSASLTNVPKQGPEVTKEVNKDGRYFINILSKERDRLIALAEGAEEELSNNGSTLPEEAAGKLRSAAGKARLLATQKMKQFEGLCQKNINQVPGEEFPTTNEDLAGFWDMVMLQVVQVNDLYGHLDSLRKSQWKEVVQEQKSIPSTPQNGSSLKRRPTPASKAKSTASSESARKAREAREQTRRQLIEERRRAMKSNANKSDANSVEIFVPET